MLEMCSDINIIILSDNNVRDEIKFNNKYFMESHWFKEIRDHFVMLFVFF